MTHPGNGTQRPLESKARHRIGDDAARIRHPVSRDPVDLESTGAAVRAELAPSDEVVGSPIALVGPEVSRAIGREVVAEEARRATYIVMRLHDEQAAARTHRAPERFEDGR